MRFPRRGSVLQPRVAVLGYPGKEGGEIPNPNGVAAGLASKARELNNRERFETNSSRLGSLATTPVGLVNPQLFNGVFG